MKIHLWFGNIFSFKGGIQTYSTFLLESLQALSFDYAYEIFIKHDKSCSPDFSTSDATLFHYSGIIPLPLRTAVFAAQLIRAGIWQRPNLIISGHLNFIVVAYLIKRLVGIPYWVIVYGLEAWDIDQPIVNKALHNADRIISISGYTRDQMMKEQNLDPAKFSILPCTFDYSSFQIAPKPPHLLQKYNLNPNQPVILTVARLAEEERYKGYDQILVALPSIRQEIPDVRYIIVGKGDDQSRIESLIKQFNLQECVTLAGFIPDAELCDYYNLCDVFAMPSKREGFGIVYLEALACGKLTLGGNQDGAVDALCQGELGALVNPDDIDEIAQTLIQILQGNYPNQLMYQPEALRQKVIETYGFEKFKQTLSSLFDEWQHYKQKPPA